MNNIWWPCLGAAAALPTSLSTVCVRAVNIFEVAVLLRRSSCLSRTHAAYASVYFYTTATAAVAAAAVVATAIGGSHTHTHIHIYELHTHTQRQAFVVVVDRPNSFHFISADCIG